MIKGVSRYAVEIDKTDSPFFEKVICFVRPQYADGHSVDLHREAMQLVGDLNAGVEETQNGTRYVLKVSSPRRNESLGSSASHPSPPPSLPGSHHEGSLPKWIPLALSAGGGAVAAIVITALI